MTGRGLKDKIDKVINPLDKGEPLPPKLPTYIKEISYA